MRVMATVTLLVWYDDAASTIAVEEILKSSIRDKIKNCEILSQDAAVVDTWDLEVEAEEVSQ